MILLQIFATQTNQQANFNFEIGSNPGLLTRLHQHQTISQRHASYFLNYLEKEIIKGYSDIESFGTMVKSFKNPLIEIIQTINSDSTAREKVRVLIGELREEAKKRQQAGRALIAELKDFNDQIGKDEESFSNDLAEANQELGKNGDEMKKIKQEISSTQTEINEAIAAVVISSLALAGGIFVIAIGAIATLPANVTATAVILTGIGIVASGAGGTITFASKLGSANVKLNQLYQKAAELDVSLALVQSIHGQVSSLFDAAGNMVTAANEFGQEWGEILNGFSEFDNLLNQAQDQADLIHLQHIIEKAATAWEQISLAANSSLKTLSSISFQQVENILELNDSQKTSSAA
ncbi:MAG: HBL/NHE enterotoxin family protein [Bacteroidia bacterium]